MSQYRLFLLLSKIKGTFHHRRAPCRARLGHAFANDVSSELRLLLHGKKYPYFDVRYDCMCV